MAPRAAFLPALDYGDADEAGEEAQPQGDLRDEIVLPVPTHTNRGRRCRARGCRNH
jgi:hypothetical protein